MFVACEEVEKIILRKVGLTVTFWDARDTYILVGVFDEILFKIS